jgi:hypothetical protein
LIGLALGPCEHPHFREAVRIEQKIQVLASRAPAGGV